MVIFAYYSNKSIVNMEHNKIYSKKDVANAIIELVEYIKKYRLSSVYSSNMSDEAKDIIMNHTEDLEWLFENLKE